MKWMLGFGVFVLPIVLSVPTLSHAQEANKLVPSVTVEGKGTVTARPDMAQIQVGVITEGKSAAEALNENNKAMEQLFGLLKQRSIPEKDIQTTQFNVSPRYRRDRSGQSSPEIVGYEVGNILQVKVRDLDRLGEILDELVSQGANRVQGIQFSVSESEELLDEARRKAMANAQHRARIYSQAAQRSLGKVQLIQEQSPQIPQPRRLQMAREAMAADQAVPVAPGEQEFEVQITVTFSLE